MRDFIVQHPEGDITIGMVADRFRVSALIAADLMLPWLDRGVLRLIDDDDGLRYRYVPPDSARNPTHRPRGEPRIDALLAPQRGVAVAYTGKPMGESGVGQSRRRKMMAKGKIRKGKSGR